MLNIVLFGPPGAGKGTQAAFLIKKFQLNHLSTGDLFRDNIKAQTPLGLKVKSFMDKGNLVPDQVTVDMLSQALDEAIAKGTQGFIFDGFPRNIHQAEVLDQLLEKRYTAINIALALEVENQLLIDRILERGKVSNRVDDQDEKTIRDRIEVYYDNTEVLKTYYQQQNKLSVVHGVGSIEAIAACLEKEIITVIQ